MSFGTEADHFYLDRSRQRQLVEFLRAVPTLVAGLDVAVAKQEKFGSGGPRIGQVERAQPLPFNERVSAAATALHRELATWVQFVCEPRAIRYWPVDYTHEFDFIGPLRRHERRIPSRDYRGSTSELAKWLDRNVSALALTPGAEEALDAIRDVVTAGFATLRPPGEEAEVQLDEAKLEDARKTEVNASAAALMAKRMGRVLDVDGQVVEDYRTLTKRRIFHLCEVGAVKPIRHTKIRGKESPVFVFGLLLDAHRAHPSLESA
ncbi:hypothetical protein [Rhodococcus sp. (in: high G+C Gram-positive bacteria)]|uniref:hypothetical protein n=1 Tax=Rhodococcus sp. TaxID=1831 RepID=UPI00257ED68B|nr:hypothetical protein [Rhodococcus sp. (in: high G+C Gram-positive bacteria)]MBQ9051731.1 hypothetical protein [Rhodococcus sp. (in: high G+C Gram-positive bacteria)]